MGWGGGGGRGIARQKKRQAETDECIEADRYILRFFLIFNYYLYTTSVVLACAADSP